LSPTNTINPQAVAVYVKLGPEGTAGDPYSNRQGYFPYNGALYTYTTLDGESWSATEEQNSIIRIWKSIDSGYSWQLITGSEIEVDFHIFSTLNLYGACGWYDGERYIYFAYFTPAAGIQNWNLSFAVFDLSSESYTTMNVEGPLINQYIFDSANNSPLIGAIRSDGTTIVIGYTAQAPFSMEPFGAILYQVTYADEVWSTPISLITDTSEQCWSISLVDGGGACLDVNGGVMHYFIVYGLPVNEEATNFYHLGVSLDGSIGVLQEFVDMRKTGTSGEYTTGFGTFPITASGTLFAPYMNNQNIACLATAPLALNPDWTTMSMTSTPTLVDPFQGAPIPEIARDLFTGYLYYMFCLTSNGNETGLALFAISTNGGLTWSADRLFFKGTIPMVPPALPLSFHVDSGQVTEIGLQVINNLMYVSGELSLCPLPTYVFVPYIPGYPSGGMIPQYIKRRQSVGH
jgi:hypothetical protein